MLGAAGVQIGTAYLFSPEATISAPFRERLAAASDDGTKITNLMTGRLGARAGQPRDARNFGPIGEAPALSACRDRHRAVTGGGRKGRFGGFFADLVRAGGGAGPQGPRGRIDPDGWRPTPIEEGWDN